VQIIFLMRVELVAVILQKRQAETVNPPERRAQVVRDGIGECLQFPVGRLELGSPLDYPPLQIGIEFENLLLRPLPLGDIELVLG
jgi:hypothetical protein